jgi:4-hydroxy-tetrahydrodipicolinate synthase
MAEMCDAAFAGDWDAARRIHERWLPLMKANFAGGPNPVPVKAAMAMMGLLTDVLRAPLLTLDEPHRARLRMILQTTGALDSTPTPVDQMAAAKSGRGRATNAVGAVTRA